MIRLKKNTLLIIFSLITLLAPFSVHGQGLIKYASTIDGIDAEQVAVYIENIQSGDVVLDVNGELPMTPASVTKLFTAATVFQTSNLSDTYKTKVFTTGTISKGELLGNLIIESSGDPTLESKHFPQKQGFIDSIVCAIQDIGIRQISGEIKIKSPKWLNEPTPTGWKFSDVAWPYGAGYYPFNYADNKIVMRFNRDGSYSFKPSTPGLKAVKGEIRKGESVWREKDGLIYNVRWKSKKPLVVEVANPLPANTFTEALKSKLNKSGIEITGPTKSNKGEQRLIYTHESPTIYEILKSLVMRSDNQMAEAMLRYAFPRDSRSEAARKEFSLWEGLGVDVFDMNIEDGSGLSRNNRLTAYNLADMLVWMALNDDNFLDFLKMFPRAGESGTLKSFLKSTSLQGRFVAKTGSLNKVQCYAGYMLDEIGLPTHVIVIMINGFKGSRANLKSTLESLLLDNLLPAEEAES